MHLELEFQPSPEDILEARKAFPRIARELGWKSKPYAPMATTIGWLVILGALGLCIGLFSPNPWSTMIYPIVLGFIRILYHYYSFSLAGLRAAFEKNPLLSETQKWTVTDESISVATHSITHTMKWFHFTAFAETKNSFLLFDSEKQAHEIPKRAFGSELELSEFRGAAQARVRNKTQGFPVQLDSQSK